MADHPYGDPFDSPQFANVLKCPVCSEKEKITPRQNQWGVWYHCDKCANEWSGGVVGVAKPDYGAIPNTPIGTAAPEEDILPEDIHWDKVGFRDPRKNYGGE